MSCSRGLCIYRIIYYIYVNIFNYTYVQYCSGHLQALNFSLEQNPTVDTSESRSVLPDLDAQLVSWLGGKWQTMTVRIIWRT